MDQAQARKEQQIKKEIERKKVAEVARRIMDWKKLPATKEMLGALQRIEESHDKYILSGKCKDMEEYLGRCFARNKARGLFELLVEFEKKYKQVLEAERRNI